MTSYFALLLLVLALGGLAALAFGRTLPDPRALPAGAALGGAAAAAMILGRLPAASVNLPLGPQPGMMGAPSANAPAGLVLAFAPDNAVFVLLMLLCAGCAGALAPARGRALAALAVLGTGMVLTVDRIHLAGAAGLLCVAVWWSGRRRRRMSGGWRGAVWPAAGLVAAFGLAVADATPAGAVLLAASGAGLAMALARAAGRDAWLAPGLAPELAAAPQAGDVPRRAAAWAGGVGGIAALVLLWRVAGWTAAAPDAAAALAYASPAAAALRQGGRWAGATMLLVGLAMAAAGAWRGLRARGLRAALTEAGFAQLGLAWVAAGLSAQEAGAALPVLAESARGAAWLTVLVAALTRIAGLCALEVVTARAGHDGLDRLGGLARLMPRQGAWLAAALAQFGPLPPLAGFAASWALLQALLAAPAGFDLLGRCGLLAVTVATAAALAGLAGIGLRVAALALLGRPRTPRVAGAEDPAGLAGWVAALPLGALALCGLFPGWALALALLPASADGGLAAAAGAAYLPAAVAIALGLAGVAAWLGWRRGVGAAETVARWEDGAPPPPAWLPFGDPDRQPGAAFLRADLATPGPRRLRRATRPWRRRAAGIAWLVADRLAGTPSADARRSDLLPGALVLLVCAVLLGVTL